MPLPTFIPTFFIPMNILALETTCDETAAAIVTDRLEVLSSVVASQDDLHRRFGGVVPEIASRAHVERILPVIHEALHKAGLTLKNIDAVAVANTPGLAGSLLVGLVAAKAICLARGIPLLAVNHLQAHIYACRLSSRGRSVSLRGLDHQRRPYQSLLSAAMHWNLICWDRPSTMPRARPSTKWRPCWACPIPAALHPDAPPKGAIPRLTISPCALLGDDDRLDFSFSGLKTAVRYAIAGPGKPDFSSLNLSSAQVADLAASFQEAVVDCLVGKAMAALRKTGMRVLCVGGGVAANARLRQRLSEQAKRQNVRLHIAPLQLCTDNAVMGAIAVERLKAGRFESLDLDVYPGMLRPAKVTSQN